MRTNFNRGRQGSGRGRGSSGENYRKNNSRGFNGGGSDNRGGMHSAICDDCGAHCEVPFKPSGDKPIYCSDCFAEKRGVSGNGNRDRGRNRSGGRSSYGGKQMFDGVCEECGADCRLPFKPSSDKPVYCSACFDQRGNKGGGKRKNPSQGGSDKLLIENLALLNEKLDIIIDLLSAGWVDDEDGFEEMESFAIPVKEEKSVTPKKIKTENKKDKKVVSEKKSKSAKKTEKKMAPKSRKKTTKPKVAKKSK